MVTQLRAMSLSVSSAELCVDEGLSADPPEEVVGLRTVPYTAYSHIIYGTNTVTGTRKP